MKLPSQYLGESQTDKTDDYHRYGDFYDMVIPSLYLRNYQERLRILEIGVSRFGKGSGHAFCSMHYVDSYVGIDIEPLSEDLPDNGTFFHREAYDLKLIELLKRVPPFHLLIDDGTHNPKDWHFFMRNYSTLCASPSVMVIEDLHTPASVDQYGMVHYHHSWSGMDGRIAYLMRLP